jgi:hypothetical protein
MKDNDYRVEGSPYYVRRGSIAYKGWAISHAEWHPCHMDVDIGQPETMVMAPNGDFELSQHGMWNFDQVTRIVCRGIDKGWTILRLRDFINKLGEREKR